MGDMTTISTCGKCGLHYRESLIPHRCADWTKGRKEVAKESHQMSEHQVNQSGNCVIEGCPCRGWSAQETASVKEINEHDPWKAVHRIKLKHEKVVEAAKLLLAMNNCNYDRDQMRRSGGFDALWEAVKAIEPNWTKESSGSHQPAARGGGDEWVFNAKMDDRYHIRSKNDYNGDCVAHTDTKARAEQICNEHNQHHSLVAERERLREALGEMLNRFYPHTCDRGPLCAKCGALRAAQSVFNETDNDQKRGAR